MSGKGRQLLDQAFEGLERELPERAARAVHWVHNSSSRWVRIPLGLVLIVTGFFGFLPIIGFEFIPLGLLIIARDVPFLQEPIAKFIIWLEQKWVALRKWRKTKHQEKDR